MITSGIRLGTPAGTSLGFGGEEFKLIGEWTGDVLDGLVASPESNPDVERPVRKQVKALCQRFPLYQ